MLFFLRVIIEETNNILSLIVLFEQIVLNVYCKYRDSGMTTL